MVYNYSNEEIRKKIAVCLGIFFKNDCFLLKNSVSERSIAHKLAEYIQFEFPDWNVDCEYNRKGFEVKNLIDIRECDEQRKTDRVSPDIIIHHRNSENNLLVIEIKVDSEDPCDIEKLKKFTSSSGVFKYKLGLFIKFDSTNQPYLRWFIDGREQKKEKIISIPLEQIDEKLSSIEGNIRTFIQDHYALMRNVSTRHAIAMLIFALEELVKYHELKLQKEIAIRENFTNVEVDGRLFGYGRKSHEYKLRIAEEKELIPSDVWTIHTAKFDKAYFDSAYFDTEDLDISADLRLMNLYIDWKEKWQTCTDPFESSRLKKVADHIIITLEKLAKS